MADTDQSPIIAALVALSVNRNARAVRKLVARYGSAPRAVAQVSTSDDLRLAEYSLSEIQRQALSVVHFWQPEYPRPVRESSDAPVLMYVRGRYLDQDDPAVAIVGARDASHEGIAVAEALGSSLAALGITVISGLARGIDAAAHRGALAGGGRTIAVLAGGVDVVYPIENLSLAAEIASAGAIISELPPGRRPRAHDFPIRNRIIAALARAVVVVEAAERSGSLITARLANEDGRTVLAIPGSPLSRRHHGSNRLLRDGAKMLLDLQDLLEELPRGNHPSGLNSASESPSIQICPPLTDMESKVMAALPPGQSRHIDSLIGTVGVPIAEVTATLLGLEIAGHIRRIPGGAFEGCSSRPSSLSGLAQTRARRAMVESSFPSQESKHGESPGHRRVAGESQNDQ